MAITRKDSPPPGEGELIFSVNNGDFKALQEVTARLKFKDEESLLRYMLAVISRSATRSVTIINEDGKSLALNPGEALLDESLRSGKETAGN